MGEGDDEKGDLPKLRKREDFHGWKEKMLLYSMEKGDTEGIFSDTGNDPTIGFQAIQAGAVGNNRRPVCCVLALLCNAVSVGRSFWRILVMSPE
mgnify:CR=1 FL=1